MLSKPTSVFIFDLSNNIKELSDVRKERHVLPESHLPICKILINKYLIDYLVSFCLYFWQLIKCEIDVTFEGYNKMTKAINWHLSKGQKKIAGYTK